MVFFRTLLVVAALLATATPATASPLPVVEVLFLYTEKAKQEAGGEHELRKVAHTAQVATNRAFVNSRAKVRTRVIGLLPAPDFNPDGKEESTAAYDYLLDKPDSAKRLRDEKHADVMALFAADVGGFSQGVPNPPSPGNADRNWMLLGHDRVAKEAELYFAHELGHLLGLAHDKVSPGPYAYARGYIAPSMKWRDIMAYESTCEEVGRKCPLIPYFSNPGLTYEGERLGIPIGQPDASDSVSMLNRSAPIVAAYR